MINIQSNSTLFFPNLMNSISFRSSFIVITEPIEQNLNGIFAKKYNKILCRMKNNEKLQEIINSLI